VSFLVRDATGVDLLGTTTFEERVALRPLRAGERGEVRLRFLNRLRAGSYGISVAINRVAHRDLTDNCLFDQIDGVAAFEVIGDPDRPVHYKFHEPVEVVVEA
jgi:lipopolysaccharide transport system ATP-binding protein